jgi:hypothetical protein
MTVPTPSVVHSMLVLLSGIAGTSVIAQSYSVRAVRAVLGFGIEAVGTPPAQFDQFFRAEVDKWARVVKATGIQGE